jgi:hypothetical protein
VASLTTFISRVAGMLHDPAGLIYDSAALESALRTALDQYNRARGQVYTIQDLDGASETSLPAIDEVIIAMGAAGHAAAARSLQRAESFNLNQAVPDTLQSWSRQVLELFAEELDRARLTDFRGQDVPCWAAQGWPLDSWDGLL